MATYQNSIANLGVRLVITHQSPDIANNRTTINYSAYVYKTNGSPWNQLSQTPMKLIIDGQTPINISNGNYDLRSTSQQLIKSGTLTIPHNSDGTKSFSFSWNVNFTSTGYGYGNVTTSGTYTLPTIPRTSSFSVASTMNTGTNYTLTISRSSDSFTHDVTYTVGGAETNVATSTTATSVTVNIPHTLFNRYPSNSTVTGTINVKTKNGSSVIGVRSQNVNINLPTNFIPSVSGLSVSNTQYAPMTASNQFIRGISRLTLTASGASGVYSSTINGYEFRYKRANGSYEGVVSSSTNSFQYSVFQFPNSGSEDLTAEVRVKDSRGRYSAWKTVPSAFRVHFYQPPSIGNIRVWRTGANNTSLNMERNYKVTPLYTGGGTTNNNTALLTFETRELGGTTSTNTGANSSVLSLTNSTATLSGTFAANKSYEVRAVLKDSIQTVYGSWIRVSTESLPMTIAPNGIGVGKAHSGGSYNLEVGSGGASIDGGIQISGTGGNVSPVAALYSPSGGVLIDIMHNQTTQMITVEVIGNAYGVNIPIDSTFQTYHYTPVGTFLNTSQLNNGFNIPQGRFFIHNNRIKLWFPVNVNFQTYIVRAYGMDGRVLNPTIVSATMPTSGITGEVSYCAVRQASQMNENDVTNIISTSLSGYAKKTDIPSVPSYSGGNNTSNGYYIIGDYQIAFGKITINSFYSSYTLTGNATFYRSFVEPPVITLTTYTGSGSSYLAGDGYVQTVTNSGFTAGFSHTGFKSGDSRVLNYIAVGKGR
ncbi:DUF859 family phage minor structural protein [Globicatella sp. PHS-GS-PNBC-21-1553]|uniref:DUF859 family phage minor structural protein n=1 Tax=Globicatella sp. PHS-GS-PNBC-21-1553 TaxID=2885764 RepID=UPI00298EF87C|nr:DUF859 family phage minor structural protein [Globicatella sp. PHS-GS-PNBC-21-1553]WPC08600.1 DUF859 domain-containing protein [Globicatella sp. PHS-GS-PNBC-21-1553]